MDLKIIIPPLIGAAIGYGTNWIAIKMLFRPLKPLKIGKFTLPFTPGIIPKRKPNIAKAIGETVGNNLFTKEDIMKVLVSEEVQNIVIQNLLEKLNNENTVRDLLIGNISEEKYEKNRNKLKDSVVKKIKEGLIDAEIGEIIATQSEKAIAEKVKNGMLKILVSDKLITSVSKQMGEKMEDYIKNHGEDMISPILEGEIISLENSTVADLSEKLSVDEEKLENKLKNVYNKIAEKCIWVLLESLNISEIVENKINEMKVEDLEKLLLKIMKKELHAIVNLGAIIGLIFGCLNLAV